MKKHRVMMLIEEGLVPPESVEGMAEEQVAPFKAEWDVYSTLRGLGHEVHKLELKEDLGVVREAVHAFKPHVVFNIVEGYRNVHVFDQHVVSYLELIDQRYTGCNPRGLTLARDKALTKKIMAYHRIHVPAFAVFPRRRSAIVCPKKLSFPLFVKSISVEGSIGISKQSLVYDEASLKERVQYIHDSLETHAIAEQYIDGRELYVGVMGNLRLQTLPAWELVMKNGDADEPLIATRKAKFDPKYQKLMGVTSRKADALISAMRAVNQIISYDLPFIMAARDTIEVQVQLRDLADPGAAVPVDVVFHGFGMLSHRAYILNGHRDLANLTVTALGTVDFRNDGSEPIVITDITCVVGSEVDDKNPLGDINRLALNIRQKGNGTGSWWFVGPTLPPNAQSRMQATLLGVTSGRAVVHQFPGDGFIWNPGDGLTILTRAAVDDLDVALCIGLAGYIMVR